MKRIPARRTRPTASAIQADALKTLQETVTGLNLDNFIVRLRRYLEDNPAKPRHLLTVRGVGYRFIVK